jgi:hypothetical protein
MRAVRRAIGRLRVGNARGLPLSNQPAKNPATLNSRSKDLTNTVAHEIAARKTVARETQFLDLSA